MNINPREAIEKKHLWEDLFYRFSSSLISLPSLKNRPEDIDLYLDYFLDMYRAKTDRLISGYSENLRALLNNYSWPGNVRELSHLVEFMVTNAEGQTMTISDLPAYMMEAVDVLPTAAAAADRRPPSIEMDSAEALGFCRYMDEIEKNLIVRTLSEHRGSIVNAAEYLQLPRQTFTYKMKKYGLDRNSFKHPKYK